MPCMSAITLTHPTANAGQPQTITLPAGLLWVDEFGWQQVVAQAAWSSTGAYLIDTWAKQAGRPITLRGEQDRAWCERGLLTTLRAWASVPGLVMTLAIRATTLQVVFDHTQGAPVDAQPLTDLLSAGGPAFYSTWAPDGTPLSDVEVDYADPRPTDPFAIQIRLTAL
jgi:hypothetical protein